MGQVQSVIKVVFDVKMYIHYCLSICCFLSNNNNFETSFQ